MQRAKVNASGQTIKDFKMSLSRKAKHVKSCRQKPLPYDFPRAKCPIDVDLIKKDLMESKLKAGRREERMHRGHL